MNFFWQRIWQIVEEQQNGNLISLLSGEGKLGEFAGNRLFFDGERDEILGEIPYISKEWIKSSILRNVEKAEIIKTKVTTGEGDKLEVEFFCQPLKPAPTLLVLGGGHIAFYLVEIGKMMGFKVTVIDDRPEFANTKRFSQADKVICADFIQALQDYPINTQTYIVIVTRGHRYDQTCVEAVLHSDAAYMGMIGSKRRVAAMKKLLLENGFQEERVNQLHAPIGLNIGAETPAEIALSIIAEVVQSRRLNQDHMKYRTGELEIDPTVMKCLAEHERVECKDKVALATIVEVKGSAPRKAGAQMLFYADGRTVGTIGGGCAEAEVKIAALSALDSGKASYYKVDLTNDVAGDEGMVCGGIMTVFLAEI